MEFATPWGTKKYQELRNIPNYHFKKSNYTQNLALSSLGMGTYLGSLNKKTDVVVEKAVIRSIESGGVNVIDTAINYRNQMAERSVGNALKRLINKNIISRDQVFISTKNGYIPGDGDLGTNSNDTYLNYLNTVEDKNIVDKIHSIDPKFLNIQLNQSLRNLKVQTIDLLYLHNVAEVHLQKISYEEFLEKIASVFEFLETERDASKIQYYGLATWNCFRLPSNQKGYVNLEDLVNIAKKVAGTDNGFKFVQVPVNISMREVLDKKFQRIGSKKVTFLESSDFFNIGVFGSVPLMQSKLLQTKVPKFPNLTTKSQNLLQFVRSIPHKSFIGPIVGHKLRNHIKDNLDIIITEPLSKEEFLNFLDYFS